MSWRRNGQTEAVTQCCQNSSGKIGWPFDRSTPEPETGAPPLGCSDHEIPNNICVHTKNNNNTFQKSAIRFIKKAGT